MTKDIFHNLYNFPSLLKNSNPFWFQDVNLSGASVQASSGTRPYPYDDKEAGGAAARPDRRTPEVKVRRLRL